MWLEGDNKYNKDHCLDDGQQSKLLSFPCLDSEEYLQNRKGMKAVQTQTHSKILPAFPITLITHQLNHLQPKIHYNWN